MQKRESKIKIRNGFSERQGIYKCNTQMQVDELDDKTRIALSNSLFDLLQIIFNQNVFDYNGFETFDNGATEFCKDLLSELFNLSPRVRHGYTLDWVETYKKYLDSLFIEQPYNEILDCLEYCCNWICKNYKSQGYGHPSPKHIYARFNDIFEKEYVGYRFIDGKITPITNEIEISAIEDALTTKHQGAQSHISKALTLLSDRDCPDYKNSIKESISAVESICQLIVGDEHATLGHALKQLEKHGVVLHPSLKEAYNKLYGYTSDEGGIRHAEGLTESEVTFAEAKYMLVSCCAFVNCLLEKYGK